MHAGEAELRTWMIASLGGDAAAHRRLLGALLPLLRGYYGRRMPGRADEIEDLVQETLIAVHERRCTYDTARPLLAWVRAIARYKMIDYLRRTRRTVPIDDMEDSLFTEGFEDGTGAARDVTRLLAGISPKQARMIRATRIEGLTSAEAAAREGIGISDVKVSVHRGLKALAMRVKGAMP